MEHKTVKTDIRQTRQSSTRQSNQYMIRQSRQLSIGDLVDRSDTCQELENLQEFLTYKKMHPPRTLP